MDKERVSLLIEKYIDQTATDSEQAELMAWYRDANEQEAEWVTGFENEGEIVRKRMMGQIMQGIGDGVPIRKLNRLWYKLAAAALILMFISFGIYRFLNSAKTNLQASHINREILPGGNKAVLTLANGKSVTLTSAKNGLLAMQGNLSVQKTRDGQLVYEASGAQPVPGDFDATASYNTITTPKGGQYEVVLPDGSHVWLNSKSSLSYPLAFTANQRLVRLTGEGYFEVTKDANRPFKVDVDDQQEVRVLGTHFNIMAYREEGAIKTTLLEGSVKITARHQTLVLRPGEQSRVDFTSSPAHDRAISLVANADLSEAIAWKNGMFYFKRSDIAAIMRQASRWYDMDVLFDGPVPDKYITGKIRRNVNAAEMLKMLEYTGVKFSTQGNKVTVLSTKH